MTRIHDRIHDTIRTSRISILSASSKLYNQMKQTRDVLEKLLNKIKLSKFHYFEKSVMPETIQPQKTGSLVSAMIMPSNCFVPYIRAGTTTRTFKGKSTN